MSVYVDKPLFRFRGWLTSCMFADTLEELSRMAYLLGLKKSWMRDTPIPHYPVTASRRAQAVSYGAIEVGPEKVKEFIKKREEAHV